ncbi:hypothetical protein [Streptomyces sp. NPDC050264]|uniref:hypothetical protein n=1 Tax=Streptomyces sp. NPDC050264 TaxID=3155038 RepID=UPI003425C08C
MSAQPVHPHEPQPLPRNAEGIAAALTGERRMDFYRELLAAAPENAESVLRRWWCEAMLDTDPGAEQCTQDALAGRLPLTSVEDVLARRRAAGLPVE